MGDRVEQLNYPRDGLDEEAMIKYLGWSPLHVAASRGHINETVRALIQARPDMCLARDRDGANPLHVAAMRGKVEVLDELYNVNPHAARARVDSAERETILHLCIKYDQLLFLKKLLEKYKGKEFVSAKDNAGNTILHLALADRRLEIIKYVINDTEIDVNAVNASNQTVMDILLGSKLEETEYIEALLQTKDGREEFYVLVDPGRLAERRNGIMVAAVLMATLAFQVGVNPPGGVWQDDKDGHRTGEAVMSSRYPRAYLCFLFYGVLSFFASILTVIFVFVDMVVRTRIFLKLTSITMYFTMLNLAMTYAISIAMVSAARGSLWSPYMPASVETATILGLIIGPVYFICWSTCIVSERKRKIQRAVKKFNKLSPSTDQPSVDGANHA